MHFKYEKSTCQFKNKTNLKIYFSRMNKMAPEESSCNYNNASKINREFKHRPREQEKANKQNNNFMGDEWSIKIFNCSQNFTLAPFARKI